VTATLTSPSGSKQDSQGDTFPWLGLRSDFLQARPQAEQLRVFDLTARVSHALRLWAVRYPLIRRVRVWPLALSVAAAAPFASAQTLISTARVSLWVFTLDDIFDEERVPEREMVRRVDRYRALVRGMPTEMGEDSLAVALREIRADLTSYPLFESLGDEWAKALCGTIDGMMCEYRWRAALAADASAPLPSYEEYVANGLYSIGGPPHIWASLITTDDASTPERIDRLRPMERIASTCIRLANDLQSYRKEVAEGNINGLVILGKVFEALGMSPEEAHRRADERVRAHIEDGLSTLAVLQRAVLTGTRRPEATIADIARFVCNFYQAHDYHTFLSQAGINGG